MFHIRKWLLLFVGQIYWLFYDLKASKKAFQVILQLVNLSNNLQSKEKYSCT